jgi:thiol-disulfide isomerase/thioredoxin
MYVCMYAYTYAHICIHTCIYIYMYIWCVRVCVIVYICVCVYIGETPVVVKYFATWCRKCAALKPKYSTLARAYGDKVIFVKMDVENAEAKTRIKVRDGVKQIPTFQVLSHSLSLLLCIYTYLSLYIYVIRNILYYI